MKKIAKLLVLLLSLALIFGAIAIIANADDEEKIVYDALTEDDIAAIDAGEWTLDGNKLIDATINVSKDLTVDLNGYAIKSTAAQVFEYKAAATVNITGEGVINLVGKDGSEAMLANSMSDDFEAKLNVTGTTGTAITINQNSDYGVRTIQVWNGAVNLKNVIINSDSPAVTTTNAKGTVGDINYAMLDSDTGAGVVWNLDTVTVNCTTAYVVASVDTDMAGSVGNTFMFLRGDKGAVNINNSFIKFYGNMFEAGNVTGRYSKVAKDDTAPAHDYKLPVYDASGNVTHYMYYTNFITAVDSSFDARIPGNARVHFIDGAGRGNAYFKDCDIDVNYTLTNTKWSQTATADDELNLVIEGGTVRLPKINLKSGDQGGNISSNSDAIFIGTKVVATNSFYPNTGRGTLHVYVGTRTNITWSTASNVLFYDTDGTCLTTIGSMTKVNGKQSGDSYMPKSASATIKYIFDPVGDPEAPYIVALASDVAETNVWTQANAAKLWSFENVAFCQTSDATYKSNPEALTVQTYEADGSYRYNHQFKDSYLVAAKGGWDHAYTWNPAGNFSLVQNGGKAYMKWYMPANPANPSQTVAKVASSSTYGNPAAMNLTMSPDLDTNTGTHKVIVYDVSFGTDSRLPENTNLTLHTRGAGDGDGPSNLAAYTVVNNKLTEQYVTRADGVTDEDLTIVPGEWYHLTVVAYADPTFVANKGTGHGVQYWFLNGKMIGYTSQFANDTCTRTSIAIRGMRWDFSSTLYVGDSLFYDNLGARYYTAPIADGEKLGTVDAEGKVVTEAVHKPEYYLYDLNNDCAFTDDSLSVSVGGKGFEKIDDAFEYAESIEWKFVPQLVANTNQLVTTDIIGQLYTNGYTYTPASGSVSFIKDYFANDGDDYSYDPDGEADVDKYGNAVYTFDSTLKVPVLFKTADGDKVVTFGVGEIPNYVFDPNRKIVKEGKTLYYSQQVGWEWYSYEIDEKTGDEIKKVNAPGVLTEEWILEDTEPEIVEEFGMVMYPVYAKADAVASNVSIVIVDRDGYLVKTDDQTDIWGGNEAQNSGMWKINFQYGQTAILNKDITTRSAIELYKRGYTDEAKNTPREQRTFALDLNGYTVTVDSTPGGADAVNFVNTRAGDSISIYSSVEGAQIKMKGAKHTTYTKKVDGVDKTFETSISTGSFVVYTVDPSTDSLARKALDANGWKTDWAKFYTAMQSNDIPELATEIYLGTATDYAGTTHKGSNLTIYGDGLVHSGFSSRDAITNIDGFTFYKWARYNVVISAAGFNGKINFTNIEGWGAGYTDNENVADNLATNLEQDALIRGEASANYFSKDNYRAMATLTVSDSSFITGHNGQWLINGGEQVFEKIYFTNFITNGQINGHNGGFKNIVVGNNVAAGRYRTDLGVQIEAGLEEVKFNKTITHTVIRLNNVEKSYNGKGDGSYTFTEAPREYIATIAGMMTKDGVNVTVQGIDGSSSTVKYAIGGTIAENDFAAQFAPINNKTYSVVFAGTVNGGQEYSATVTGETNIVLDTKIVSNVNGMLANLSLYSGFEVNVYVPKAYVEYINTITVDGAAVAVSDAKVVVIDGKEYIKLVADKNALEISDKVTVVVNYVEGEQSFDVTSSISILDYAKVILAGNYTDEEKALMKYIIAYANVANTVKGVENEEVAKAATENAVTAYEKNYVAISEEDSAAIGTVFANCVIDLKGSVPAYVFTVAADYNGKVTLNGVEYEAVAGKTITVEGIRAYDFLAGVTVEAEGVNVTFTFSNYGAWAAAGNVTEAEMTLVNALYDYCYAAELFIAKKNA